MFDFVLDPAYRLVEALSQVTGAGLAIVLVALAVRLSLLPLSVRVARAQRIRTRLAPQVDRLRTRWKNDPQRLLREVNALHAKEGVGRFTGYLPAFAQSPFFMVTYRLFTAAVIAGHPNLLLAQSVLGVPLGEHLAAAVAGAGLAARRSWSSPGCSRCSWPWPWSPPAGSSPRRRCGACNSSRRSGPWPWRPSSRSRRASTCW
ncbi:hypothetical protein GCM10027612_09790 [Microbispora bryophytorum subsp. camponoti]